MKKMLFVMNPNAGMRKARRYLSEILGAFCQAGYQVTTHITSGPGDAVKAVAYYAHETELIVCCGGDGTFNETVNGLLQSGCDVPIGYIPAGSTNDFAASLHIPTQPLEAVRSIIGGVPVPYDIGRFRDRYFTYVASFGAFTRTSYATSQSVKNALGHTAYLLNGIKDISQIHSTHVKVELDDEVIEDDFIFGAVSNSTSVGGILTLDPTRVDMRDGKFEVLLVRAPKKMGELTQCLQALQSKKYNCQMLTFRSSSRIRVTADPNMDWTLDGEHAAGAQELEIDNCHLAIRLMQVPQGKEKNAKHDPVLYPARKRRADAPPCQKGKRPKQGQVGRDRRKVRARRNAR